MKKVMMLIDMQSFYASIEKASYPAFRDKPLVVSGDPERRSGIILAACPLAKSFGIETTEPLWQAKQKCPHLVVMRPRMQTYINASVSITSILYQFTDLIEPYSIDEQFLDVTGSYHLWQDYWTLSRRIQEKIKCEIGVFARIGISHNKVLAKMACDIFAKKRADGLFELKEEDIATHLWPQPINKMFGVGHRLTYHLQHLGVRTIGDLANYPLDRLKKRWGINGHILWLTANGYDNSPVCPQSPAPKSIGHQMTLPKDYEQLEDIQVILLELSEEVGRRARKHRYVAQTVSLGCRGGNFDLPQGFYHQQTLTYSTNATLPLYKACCDMLYRFWAGYPIRSLSITLSQLFSSDEYQLNLFHNQDKDERLHQAIDKLNERFGVATIIRATSLTEAGQAKIRAKKIGGHFL